MFGRGEHESLVLRADQLLKRKRLTDPAVRNTIDAARAASLIHLARFSEASSVLAHLEAQGLDAPASSSTSALLQFAKHYLAWATSEPPAAESAKLVTKWPGNDARRLEAQLLYRSGQYRHAANIYASLLSAARADFAERSKPTVASRWRLTAAKPAAPPLTAAEISHFESLLNELATNHAAALVLGGLTTTASEISQGLPASYELEYNKACAEIHAKDRAAAEVCLEKAEALVRADLDEDEEDMEEVIAPIKVQKAYLRHLAGDIAVAKGEYAQIMAHRRADAASLAVAANNLTVALGQLAFGKTDGSSASRVPARDGSARDISLVLPKEQHDALVEGLKKMRATSGKTVERKLALNQRRAMARNRAILLVQMGRHDACRAELAKLKSDFPDDPLVPLIEASLVAKQGNLDVANKILDGAGDSRDVRAARVQLAAAHGFQRRAALLLQELFSSSPAAIVTAACLLEEDKDVDGALLLLKKLADRSVGPQSLPARKALASFLLRNSKYRDAADVLRVVCKAHPNDTVAQAQLVVAASHFDSAEAENAALLLPLSTTSYHDVDCQQLESLPPPKRKASAGRGNAAAATMSGDDGKDIAAQKESIARERKQKKRKKRLPKHYDPEGPPPDPERWLPKTLRSGYKKKKVKTDANSFRGSQGADAAAAEAAAVKNAERSAARLAGMGTEVPLPQIGRAKMQRKKKNRR